MNIGALSKTIIVANYHFNDISLQMSYKTCVSILESKGFILVSEDKDADLLIYKNQAIERNEKITHIHFDSSDSVIRFFHYVNL